MLAEVDKLVGPDIPIRPTQGSYSNGSLSAGTHAGGGAVDLSVRNPRALTITEILVIVKAMRKVGFAAWYRAKPEWSGDPHIHGIAVGCPDLDPAAAAQVLDLKHGLNGLASHGRDRHADMKLPVITWEQYLKGKEEEVTPHDIAKAVWNYDGVPHNKPGAAVNSKNPVDPENPTWRAVSVLEDMENRLRVLELKLDKLIASLQDDGK